MPDEARNVNSFLQLIRRSERGRLKVYLGYAPGVGKTYLMLQEGHRLKQEGIDVVVGLVETHGRQETAALIDRLEVVPRRQVEYRGITLEEMDVEAILERRPQVALVDELAHTNPPTSANPKRYMDVQDLLAAGIHVISTMNVQHLESLYNTVEGMVNVKVSERLPDVVLKEADQIVNVDISPEDLQKRLKSGRIYPPERVPLAMENYFRETNLEQLRELTLRESASQIDFKRREHAQEPDKLAPDQIMVCLGTSNAINLALVRYASRLAGRLNRRWYALHVQTSKEDPLTIEAGTQRQISEALTLANQLGAMVFTFKSESVGETILRFAHEYRVGHIVIGRPRPLGLLQRWRGKQSVVQELIEKGAGMRIVVVDEHAARAEPEFERPSGASKPPIDSVPSPNALADLTSDDIVIWDLPLTKSEVLKQLSKRIAECHPDVSLQEVQAGTEQREQQMSTFLNEGLAVPHAVMPTLHHVVHAIGIPQAGVLESGADKPIEMVLMSLYPPHLAETYLRLLASVATLMRDRQFRKALANVTNENDALALINASSRA
jgi:two-component system sensor histidine kinase KdpD